MSALTKILVVLQLVFSLILSVLLVLGVSKLDNYKAQADAAVAGRVGSQAALVKLQDDVSIANAAKTTADQNAQSAAGELQKERTQHAQDLASGETQRLSLASQLTQAQTQLATATSSIATLTSSNAQQAKRLEELVPQVSGLTQRYNDVYRVNNELQNQLRGAEQAIRKLEEQLASSSGGTTGPGAAAPGSEGQVQVMSSAANQPSSQVNGKITDIAQSAGRTLIELPLGTRDGMQSGTKLMIYRGSNYVGEARVEKVTPDQSVAVVTGTKSGETVQKGDLVSNGQ